MFSPPSRVPFRSHVGRPQYGEASVALKTRMSLLEIMNGGRLCPNIPTNKLPGSSSTFSRVSLLTSFREFEIAMMANSRGMRVVGKTEQFRLFKLERTFKFLDFTCMNMNLEETFQLKILKLLDPSNYTFQLHAFHCEVKSRSAHFELCLGHNLELDWDWNNFCSDYFTPTIPISLLAESVYNNLAFTLVWNTVAFSLSSLNIIYRTNSKGFLTLR